jgi:rhamnogalacturonan endolyase
MNIAPQNLCMWFFAGLLGGLIGCGDLVGYAINIGAPEETIDAGTDSDTEPLVSSGCTNGTRQMENLDRGVVAVAVEGGVFVSWRLLGCDALDAEFNVYRSGIRVNDTPLTGGTNLVDPDGTLVSLYSVRKLGNGVEQSPSEEVPVWPEPHLTIPLSTLEDNFPNDGSVGDLDGDGDLELVIKQEMTPLDNAFSGFTDETKLEAYQMDGTLMWRVNLGLNIREGPHYTPFIVYDLDGDGRAEVAVRTSDGTMDGAGQVLGDPDAIWRDELGFIYQGTELLTVFDGETGQAWAIEPFIPPRHPDTSVPTPEQIEAIWGDNYGNRSDRFLAGVAYLDGKRPSLIMTRGCYTRSVITAWNFRNGELNRIWKFDSDIAGPEWEGQANHNLSIGDIDDDGLDEIVAGAMAVDDNGYGLWNSRLGHGDAMHLSDFIPSRPGLEVFGIHEGTDTPGSALLSGMTGEIIWQTEEADPPRGAAGDIYAEYDGVELWDNRAGMMNVKGERLGNGPSSLNFLSWWDGDLLRELLDGNRIFKPDGTVLLEAEGCEAVNGTKATPVLSADLIGDWREEVIFKCGSDVRLFTTTIPTDYRFYTLMHDPHYRVSIAWQNAAFNQPPHLGYFLGPGMSPPTSPDIYVK